MLKRAALLLSLAISAPAVLAVDRWIPIAGTVSNFRTDTRVINPSGEKDIEISAYFLPVGRTDNAAIISAAPKKFTVPKRSMLVLDDVATALFNVSGIGAILLTSPDQFSATSRIYATVATGTLGQFTVAGSPGSALTKGLVMQLQSDSIFRTNLGAVNITNATTQVTWNLYDKTNKKVATEVRSMAAYEVLGPTNVTALFQSIAAGADLSQAWVAYQSTNPIFAYGSARDLRTDDPVYIPAEPDTGSDPVVQPTTKTVDVTAVNWSFSVVPSAQLNRGDQVKFVIRSGAGSHGFQLFTPTGTALFDSFVGEGQTVERTITLPASGTYTYLCTVSSCGVGHSEMHGTFNVQ